MTRPSKFVLRNWNARGTAGHHSRRPQPNHPAMVSLRVDGLRDCQLEGCIQSLEGLMAMPVGLGMRVIFFEALMMTAGLFTQSPSHVIYR
jgi:hypothetical protein